jgi:peptidoglycan hydrolase-like protein with peptidoglycan-binding domain
VRFQPSNTYGTPPQSWDPAKFPALLRGGTETTSSGAKIDKAANCAVSAVVHALKHRQYPGRGSWLDTVDPRCNINFGPTVLNEIKTYQRSAGLTPDGIVGPATYAALGLRGSAGSPSFQPGVVPALPGAALPTPDASAPIYTRPWFPPVAAGTVLGLLTLGAVVWRRSRR